jgi:cytochrome c-type biogenesis protein CcmE
MTRKQQRTALIIGAVAFLGIAVGLILYALRDTIVFFYTPSEVMEKKVEPGTRLRLGGLVEKGSLKQGEDGMIFFAITDTSKTIRVSYKGVLPDLFREGQGVVAEGVLRPDGTFVADTVLAKHDEKYMPREVADALKKQGYWQHAGEEGGGEPSYGQPGKRELTQ